MLLIAILVFFAVFAIIGLLLMTFSRAAASRQTQATLAGALEPLTLVGGGETLDVRKTNLLSSIPLFHTLLSQMDLALEMRTMLSQADLNWTPGRLLLNCAGAWMISALLIDVRTDSTGVSALVGLLAAAGPVIYVLRRRGQRLRQIQQKLPEALNAMASGLRAGKSMGSAFSAAAKETPEPVGRELRICAEEQNFGVNLRGALDNLTQRVPLADMRMLTTAMLIHNESGGNLAEVLDKTSHVIRERFQLLQQIRVQTAQGRLTGWVLSLLPIGLGLLLYLLNPDYINVLFDRSVGHKIVALAVVMNVAGLLIIRRIVNIRI